MNVTLRTTIALSLVLLLTGAGRTKIKDFTGTWTGTSTCIGDNPSCKDETVVYRIAPIKGQPTRLRMFGDRIVNGKRVPMGALDFDYIAENDGIRCQFKQGTSTVLLAFTMAGDHMVGMLVAQPQMAMLRDLKVRRVKKDSEVPPAPDLKAYE